MPIYTAYCPTCESEQEYFSSVADRDTVQATLPRCCDTDLRRKMPLVPVQCQDASQINANNPDVETGTYTQLGVDEKGDWRRKVRTKHDIVKLHDDYNAAWEGERRANVNFGGSFGSSQAL